MCENSTNSGSNSFYSTSTPTITGQSAHKKNIYMTEYFIYSVRCAKNVLTIMSSYHVKLAFYLEKNINEITKIIK